MTEIKKLSERGSTKPNSQYYTDSICKLHQKHEKIKRFLNKTSEKINGGTDGYGDDNSRLSVAPDEELEQTVGQLVVWLTGKGNKGYFYDITNIKYDRKVSATVIKTEEPTGALPEEEGQLRTNLPVSSNLPSSAENASGEKKNARFSVAPDEELEQTVG